jgi:hypothetical protein
MKGKPKPKDPIRGYLDAVQAYEQERTNAKTLIDRISTVANAMQNQPSLSFPSFGFSAFRGFGFGFGFAFITVSNAFSNRSQASGNPSIPSS